MRSIRLLIINLSRFFSSINFSAFISIILIASSGLATLSPKETQSWKYVYGTVWFETIIWILGINLACVLIRYKTYKKIPFLFFHLSIIAILIGSGITRHFGFKGTLHLRDNQTKSNIIPLNRANSMNVKAKNLGFRVRLDKFVMRTYPGSMQPSSYDSYITIIDNNSHKTFKYHIYMNHILVYKGYRFYQESYDMDGKGSILSVSYDPGMYVTYFGYVLFIIGFLLATLYRKSQFMKNVHEILKKQSVVSLVLFFTLISLNSHAFNLKEYSVKSLKVANEFSKILVQSNGRIEPLDTLDLDIIHKLTMKSKMLGLNYNQIVAGMVSYPEEFEKIPLIYVANPEIRKMLNIKGEYASYDDFITKKNIPIFFKEVFVAMHTPDFKRTQTQRDWIRLNKLVYIAYLVFNSDITKIFPLPNSKKENYTWYSPVEIQQLLEKNQIEKSLAKRYLNAYIKLIKAIRGHNYEGVKSAREEIYHIQKRYSGPILPSPGKIKWEIKYNHMQIFPNLIWIYTLLGLASLIVGFIEIAKEKRFLKTTRVVWVLGLLSLLAHTFNMGLRWYIAGHAPWSDAYESIIFIAWAAAFSSLLFFRKSSIGLGSGLFVAGMFMIVANLDNINPQITNIVPVLNSFWLIIHVAFSIISYGFLSVAAMLGLINLILHLFKKRKSVLNKIAQFNKVTYVYLVIGLGLLSFGTIFGAIWANESWGAYWSWDPKETWSFISILVYAFVIHKNIMYKTNNKSISFPLMSFLSYFFILMTYFGVNFYIAQGLHSYGRSNGSPLWFYIIAAGIVGWFLEVIVLVSKNFKKLSKNDLI